MEKKKFCKKVMSWLAACTAVATVVVGLCFGKVIEGSLFAEVSKWFVGWLVVTGILEGFAYFLAPLYWHFEIDRKDEDKKR